MIRLIALAVLLAAVSLVGCGRDPRPGTSPQTQPPVDTGLTVIPPQEREPAPTIAGDTLDGGTLAVADFVGRPVILNAWATWCAPCREEIPLLVAAAEDNPGVQFVGLDVQDRPAAAESFVAEMGVQYPNIVDPDASLLAQIPGVPPKALPSTVAIDRQGRIAARVIGPVSDSMIPRLLAAARQ